MATVLITGANRGLGLEFCRMRFAYPAYFKPCKEISCRPDKRSASGTGSPCPGRKLTHEVPRHQMQSLHTLVFPDSKTASTCYDIQRK